MIEISHLENIEIKIVKNSHFSLFGKDVELEIPLFAVKGTAKIERIPRKIYHSGKGTLSYRVISGKSIEFTYTRENDMNLTGVHDLSFIIGKTKHEIKCHFYKNVAEGVRYSVVDDAIKFVIPETINKLLVNGNKVDYYTTSGTTFFEVPFTEDVKILYKSDVTKTFELEGIKKPEAKKVLEEIPMLIVGSKILTATRYVGMKKGHTYKLINKDCVLFDTNKGKRTRVPYLNNAFDIIPTEIVNTYTLTKNGQSINFKIYTR